MAEVSAALPCIQTKIKSTMSVLDNHAIRHEWLAFNPIAKVRTAQKRLREKNVVEAEGFRDLLEQLSVRNRAMVLLAASTGLRRSELVALTWSDLKTATMEISISIAYVRGRFGVTKTEASGKPVPLHLVVLEALTKWRKMSSFAEDHDFLFASLRMNGTKPLCPISLAKKAFSRPSGERESRSRLAGISCVIHWRPGSGRSA